MDRARKQRVGFRPTVNEASLEGRVVMASGVASAMQQAAAVARFTAPPFNPAQTVTAYDLAQTRSAYGQAFHTAYNNYRWYVTAQINQLYANGRPTSQQFADFKNNVSGAANALALNLSSQYALLPATSQRLVPNLQSSLLGNGRNSLASQVNNLQFGSRNALSARNLQNYFNQVTNSSFNQNANSLSNYIGTTNFNRLSVDNFGNRIPLSRYQANQLFNQFGNSLGLIANNFGSLTPSNSALFPNGTTDALGNPIAPNQAALAPFQNMYRNALLTSANQFNAGLSVIPGYNALGSTFRNTVQNQLFGNGTTGSGLFGQLNTLPYGENNYQTAVQNTFGTAYNGLLSNLNTVFGVPSQPGGFTLPTSNFSNPFGSAFTNSGYNSGFNNGFATNGNAGFFGFGTAPNTFNSSFGTGFNNFTAAGLTNYGYALPSYTGQNAVPGLGNGGGLI
ncbi:MAG: hypothetical protein U0835_01390 [Isosphaeraceae bacterium]